MRQRRYLSLSILVMLVVSLLWADPTSAQATLFVVDTGADDADAHDVNPGDCTCADTWGSCPLRAALEEANACPGPDVITFQSSMNIYLSATEGGLPYISETVTIDASGAWDTVNDSPGVMLNGQGANFIGLYLSADSCQVYGLFITYFNAPGIYVDSAFNQIGGAGAGQRNVLSGNVTGIILNTTGATSNLIRGNYIGLTPAGNTKNPNDTGVLISGGATNNDIGGSQSGEANFISGNNDYGIIVESSNSEGNWIKGNGIGISADLSTDLGNGRDGIRVQKGPVNTIIGGGSGLGNLISHNADNGVYVVNAGSGTDVTHNLISGNDGDGVTISTGGCSVNDNLISGNGLNGVRVVGASAAGNLIWPNSIFGNGGKGIYLQDGGNADIAAPTISSTSAFGASGTSCPSCRVALYSDSSDEGQVYHDIVWADASGNWSYSGALLGPNLTATSIDGIGNTSEFSAPHAVPGYRVFLPLMQR